MCEKKDILNDRVLVYKHIGSEGMKNIKRKHTFICVFLFIGMLMATPLIVSNFFLPSEIKLIVGEEHHFNFDVPLMASILKGDGLIIKDDSERYIEKNMIKLKRF